MRTGEQLREELGRWGLGEEEATTYEQVMAETAQGMYPEDRAAQLAALHGGVMGIAMVFKWMADLREAGVGMPDPRRLRVTHRRRP